MEIAGHGRWALTLLIAVVPALGVSAPAPAREPHTDATRAQFDLEFKRMRVEQCVSRNDGARGVPAMGYAELETRYVGQVEGDPRLEGRIELHGKGLARAEPDDGPFVPDTGQAGHVRGKVEIKRSADDRIVRGRFRATLGKPVRTPPQPPGAVGFLQFEGSLVADVPGLEAPETLGFEPKGEGTDEDYEGGRLISSFVGASDGPTADRVTGVIGGLSDDDLASPAFIQGGDCVGPTQVRHPGDPFVPQDPTQGGEGQSGDGNGRGRGRDRGRRRIG